MCITAGCNWPQGVIIKPSLLKRPHNATSSESKETAAMHACPHPESTIFLRMILSVSGPFSSPEAASCHLSPGSPASPPP